MGVEFSDSVIHLVDFSWLVVYYPRNEIKETDFPGSMALESSIQKTRANPVCHRTHSKRTLA